MKQYVLSGLIVFSLCFASSLSADSSSDSTSEPSYNSRQISFSLQVPNPGWSGQIKKVYKTDKELWVVTRLTHSGGPAAAVIDTVRDVIEIPAPDLPVTHYVLGKDWNWSSNDSYVFLHDEDQLQKKVEDSSAKLIWENGKLLIERSLDDRQKDVVKGSNSLAWTTLRTLYPQSNPPVNTAFSPLGVSLSMTMMLRGSSHKTKEELQSALPFADHDLPTIFEEYIHLFSKVEANQSNVPAPHTPVAIWHHKNTSKKNTKQDESLPVTAYTQKLSTSSINEWTNRITNGQITAILDELPEASSVIMTNPAYFTGKWTQPFSSNSSETGSFTTPAGNEVAPEMLHQTSSVPYVETKAFRAVFLPLGKDRKFRAAFVLPEESTSIARLLKEEKQLSSLDRKAKHKRLQIRIPKFQITTTLPAKSLLNRMGIKRIFQQQADFSLIFKDTSGPLHLTQFLHKTKLHLNKSGINVSTSDAQNHSGLSSKNQPNKNVPSFDVNRPFLILIQHAESGAILFLGAVTRPTK